MIAPPKGTVNKQRAHLIFKTAAMCGIGFFHIESTREKKRKKRKIKQCRHTASTPEQQSVISSTPQNPTVQTNHLTSANMNRDKPYAPLASPAHLVRAAVAITRMPPHVHLEQRTLAPRVMQGLTLLLVPEMPDQSWAAFGGVTS